MKIEITTRNYQLSERLREVTDRKLSKLDKYFEDEAVARVCFKKQGATSTTEIMLDYCGKFVRATASGENFYDTIDEVLPKIEGQIRKYRTRFDSNRKNVAYKDQTVFEKSYKYEDGLTGNVVKQKRFTLKPMTVEEASQEMELLGHTFYVFLEAKTNTVQVIYKRDDGDLGLIEPQI